MKSVKEAAQMPDNQTADKQSYYDWNTYLDDISENRYNEKQLREYYKEWLIYVNEYGDKDIFFE